MALLKNKVKKIRVDFNAGLYDEGSREAHAVRDLLSYTAHLFGHLREIKKLLIELKRAWSEESKEDYYVGETVTFVKEEVDKILLKIDEVLAEKA